MKRFEYKYTVEEFPFYSRDNHPEDEHPNTLFERFLNELGRDGWELINEEHVWTPSLRHERTSRDVPRGHMTFTCTFKREVEPEYG